MTLFESNVIYIGTKTNLFNFIAKVLFESNVIYIGTKTKFPILVYEEGLRVM